MGTYYLPRWTMFVNYCAQTQWERYNTTSLQAQLRVFEGGWQLESWGGELSDRMGAGGKLAEVLEGVVAGGEAGAFGL